MALNSELNVECFLSAFINPYRKLDFVMKRFFNHLGKKEKKNFIISHSYRTIVRDCRTLYKGV